MKSSAFKVLEYEKIIKMLEERATCSMGKELARKLVPSTDYEEVAQNLMETQEAVNLLNTADPPLGGIYDLRGILKKLQLGIIVELPNLMDILNTMYAMRAMKRFFKEIDGEFLGLKEKAKDLEILGQLEQQIEAIVDEHGQMKDSASMELMRIRGNIRNTQKRIKGTIDSILHNPDYQKYFQDNIVTIRNERYVIPVKQEYRHQFSGIIHDQSSSGSTLFIEPMAIVELNNNVKQLILDEEREVQKILERISRALVKAAHTLLANCEILAELDFAFAKGKLAKRMHGIRPALNEEGRLKLIKACHPLIARDKVVPIDFRIGEDFNTLLITGPNTGGKTVSMKTVGLLVLMAQSGCFIPAAYGSEVSVFTNVYADIGDEQSIEQSLSTFSAHMKNIVDILAKIESTDLLLLDEIGSGTDPEEGAALAMAIIEKLMNIGAKVVATTHYNELKTFAYATEGIENASVEFDINSLKPTYRLLIGIPGASNAFAISSRLGLSDAIILRAKQLIKADHAQFSEVLNTLENEKLIYEQMNADITERQQRVEKLEKQLADMKAEMQRKKDQTLRRTKEQCATLLRQTRRESEEIIKSLKAQFSAKGQQEMQDNINLARHHLAKGMDRVRIDDKNTNQPGTPVDIKTLEAGDTVFVTKLQQKATVLEIRNKELFVQLGAMKMTVKAKDCTFVAKAKKETAQENKGKQSRTSYNMLAKVAAISPEVDIRGLMVDEAIEVVSKYLDDAVIAGLPRILIIHGKGTGALRKGIQEYLKKHPNVLRYTLGNIDEGGSGVTAVELK